ncbi:MAG: hypothetical protein ACI910_000617 [Oleispira sp.]|jgi:hypothetical protein
MRVEAKDKLKRYLESENITSVLNNTKWKRLFSELKNIEGYVDFQRKDVNEEFTNHEYWCMDIYNIFAGWENIEWLNIRALTVQRRGALVKPKIENNIQLLLKAISKSGVPYCMNGDGIRIYGYLRIGVSPDWVNT